jgi:hypothetical protein
VFLRLGRPRRSDAHLSRADHHAGVGVLIGDGGDAGGGNVAGIVIVIGVVGVMMMIVIIVVDDIISMANSMSASSTTISVSDATTIAARPPSHTVRRCGPAHYEDCHLRNQLEVSIGKRC